jgi:hypothetical protein
VGEALTVGLCQRGPRLDGCVLDLGGDAAKACGGTAGFCLRERSRRRQDATCVARGGGLAPRSGSAQAHGTSFAPTKPLPPPTPPGHRCNVPRLPSPCCWSSPTTYSVISGLPLHQRFSEVLVMGRCEIPAR